MIEKGVDKIDTELLAEREKQPPLASLAKMRSRVSILRNRLSEHRPVIHGLLRADFTHVAGQPHADYFHQLERHFERTEDSVDRAREIISSSFELYATRTAQETNKLVRTLTLATVVLGFAGALSGIMGMNFDTPIPKSGLIGFFVTVSIIVVVSLATVALALRRKWL